MTRRIERVNGLLRREIGELLLTDIRDPRLAHLVSIISVETSADLRFASVRYSVMGTEQEKQDVLAGLNSAAPFIRKELKARLVLRLIPEISFVQDDSIERADQVLRIMNSLESEKERQRE